MRIHPLVSQLAIVLGAFAVYHLALRPKSEVSAIQPQSVSNATSSSAESDIAQLKTRVDEQGARLDALARQGTAGSSESRESAAPPDFVTHAELAQLLESLGGGKSLEALTDPEQLHAFKARYEEKLRAYWKARTPQIQPQVSTETDAKTTEAMSIIDAAVREVGDDPERLRAALSERLKALQFKHDGQVTIIDKDGDFVYHVQGLKGSSLDHKNVSGQFAYQDVLGARAPTGNLSYYDFVQDDKARNVYLNYRKLDSLGWCVLVEGHAWEPMH